MSAAQSMHLSKIRRLESEGWQQADYYPWAMVAIMVRGEQTITVFKNGRVKAGVHPPRS